MFKILKVKPLFTGIVTTSTKYVGDVTTAGGLLVDTTRMSGSLNPYQRVISVGDMCKDIKEGDIVKINFKRYAKAKHTPGAIDEAQNKQFDNMTVTYEIPMINLDEQECLFLQSNDIEYIVTKYEVDEGGITSITKDMASKKMNAEQLMWQAESDADTMARYEEIMSSSSRRTAAMKAARTRAADLNRRADMMTRVAGKKTSKGNRYEFFTRCTMLWHVITSDDIIMLSYKNGVLDGLHAGNSQVISDLHGRLASFIKNWVGQYKHNHSTDEAD